MSQQHPIIRRVKRIRYMCWTKPDGSRIIYEFDSRYNLVNEYHDQEWIDMTEQAVLCDDEAENLPIYTQTEQQQHISFPEVPESSPVDQCNRRFVEFPACCSDLLRHQTDPRYVKPRNA